MQIAESLTEQRGHKIFQISGFWADDGRMTGKPDIMGLWKSCRPTAQNQISGTRPTSLKASLATPGWNKWLGSRHVRGDYKTLERLLGPVGEFPEHAFYNRPMHDSRKECHLCDIVKQTLTQVQGNADFQWREVDIDADPPLRQKYNDEGAGCFH